MYHEKKITVIDIVYYIIYPQTNNHELLIKISKLSLIIHITIFTLKLFILFIYLFLNILFV